MAAPEDSADVLSALRLGWYLAEVRGRNRPGGPVPHAESLPNRLGHVLPLRIEAPGKPGARRPDAVAAEEMRKRTLTTTADAAVP